MKTENIIIIGAVILSILFSCIYYMNPKNIKHAKTLSLVNDTVLVDRYYDKTDDITTVKITLVTPSDELRGFLADEIRHWNEEFPSGISLQMCEKVPEDFSYDVIFNEFKKNNCEVKFIDFTKFEIDDFSNFVTEVKYENFDWARFNHVFVKFIFP